MKFGHVLKERLKSEGFPPEWVDSAISYQQLKKCIHRLTDELAQVGLDPVTLGKLLKHVEDYNTAAVGEEEERPFEYILSGEPPPGPQDGDGTGSAKRPRKPFHPKLLFKINEATGALHSAKLDKETKSKLHMLAVETGLSDLRVLEEPDSKSITSTDSANTTNAPSNVPCVNEGNKRPGYRTVEVPLTSDTEFFAKLTSELSGLEKLQEKEEKKLHGQIEELGKQISKLTNPDRRANKKLIAVWRQIFQLYIESGIFFGTTETDHTAHDAEKAAARFQAFVDALAEQGLVAKFKKPENTQALNMFININREILQGLRFGEINRMAMMKILKKFDKKTALGVKATVPKQIEYPEFSEHLAKAVCAEVNTQILSHVPQLDEYNCPMCFDIEWRPVKLRCGHVFCIRCLIVMQTNHQHRCPLCREKTVIDANSDNLDLELADFLKKWFPDEVKAKQKYNELMAGVDQYGEVYKDKCAIM
ncbi:RING-14 protein-like protein [Lindgomyces ingoldianus]|uniref:RING-14 protein-like protein n=1 Tax=Lindgomyces ingoldianus TaxID=673940 RepID=A0ACB6QHZ3_9PLEO|nr:RING-14 protein-like protein [Lindgomyces ingoldianus]KAF2466546.1 RING-14 protein-like protein [Lindgomyces ingoldianus]